MVPNEPVPPRSFFVSRGILEIAGEFLGWAIAGEYFPIFYVDHLGFFFVNKWLIILSKHDSVIEEEKQVKRIIFSAYLT